MKQILSKLFFPIFVAFFLLSSSIPCFAEEEYPLRDLYYDYFVMSNDGAFLILDDGSHQPVEPWLHWKWDDEYILRNIELRADQRPLEYKVQRAIEDNNLLYLNEIASVPLIAELVGPPWSDYAKQNMTQEGIELNQRVIQEIMKFYDSFPNWRTATDLEKAIHICNWIAQADYDHDLNDSSYSLYGCLVEKKAVCQGYTSAAKLLGTCVGLPVQTLTTINHTYPIFWVNGVWLANEPTSKNNYLSIAHVYDPNYYLALKYVVHNQGLTRDDYLYNWQILYPLIDTLKYKGPGLLDGQTFSGYGLNTVLEYCRNTNYTIPTTLDKTLFPNQGYSLAYGKEMPIIYIR